MRNSKLKATFFAFIAAVFYALNAPFSKILLNDIPPTMMAAFLYLGAGLGIGAVSLTQKEKGEKLTKTDISYTIGMVLLDIAAPIFLMFGLANTSASSASLLNNFEIVATTLIALAIFHEKVSLKLWIGIGLITLSSIILSCTDISNMEFSWGSLLVLLAAVCWGFENNCTRKISSKSTYEIVFIKGIFSGLGSLITALIIGEKLPKIMPVILALLLGFAAYGLSIFFYIKAQNHIGAARTSAYYSVAPFIGALLSFVFLKESLTANYFIALAIMFIGSGLAVADTLSTENTE